MENNQIPKPGEIYNHFKNKPYQIITVAMHTETHEIMVVYQALYGDFRTYVRPLASFISEVDSVKYPDVKQKYRFELQAVNHITYAEAAEAKGDIGTVTNKDCLKTESAADIKQDASKNQVAADYMQEKNYIADIELKQEAIHNVENEQRQEAVNKADNNQRQETIHVADMELNVDHSSKSIADTVPDDDNSNEMTVNPILMQFLEAESFYKKLEIITSNRKHMSDRLINDLAVSLDCTVDEGPLEQRIQGLIYCLQALCRFENKRLR